MLNIRSILFSLFTCVLTFNIMVANAAPPEDELNAYLNELGWTNQEFIEYLAYYEIPLAEFSSVDELKAIMGTPIGTKNSQELLTKYNLTEKELKYLLAHFGDSLEQYKFIEDLDAAVEFYSNQDEYMNIIKSELAKIGITDDEVKNLFTYLTQVEENNRDQLDQMEALDFRLEKYLHRTDFTNLPEEELTELVQLLEEAIALSNTTITFTIDNKDIALQELINRAEIPSTINAKIYSTNGELLMDFSAPAKVLETVDVIDEGENMIHLGEISDDYVDHMHEEKYKTARKELK